MLEEVFEEGEVLAHVVFTQGDLGAGGEVQDGVDFIEGGLARGRLQARDQVEDLLLLV